VLGTTMFVYPPATGSETYEYGMVDHAFGDGWIWKGANGSFTVAAGATSVTATGMTLSPFGAIDMRLSLDSTALEPNTCAPAPCTPAAWDFAGGVKVKGSAWGWYEVPVASIGGGVYQFVLSDFAGLGKQLYHTGLTASGDAPQFVFVFYAADGITSKEYKVGAGGPPTTGVTADTKAPAGAWTAATVQKQASGDLNTYITVP
jgi:hypothetical protein